MSKKIEKTSTSVTKRGEVNQERRQLLGKAAYTAPTLMALGFLTQSQSAQGKPPTLAPSGSTAVAEDEIIPPPD